MGVRKDGLWGLLVRLPDNPETKSYNSFTFNREIDALKYGWDETNNIVNFVATLFQDIKTKSQET